jgi:hypothetical protein
MRRFLVGIALLVAAPAARADLSVPSNAHGFPLGHHCAAALDRARHRAGEGFNGEPELTVSPAGATAQFHVSDMCGVSGDGTLRLERDSRPDAPWHRLERSGTPGNYHVRLTRRRAGWRAVIDITVEGLSPGDFEGAFRDAVDVCIAGR